MQNQNTMTKPEIEVTDWTSVVDALGERFAEPRPDHRPARFGLRKLLQLVDVSWLP